MTRPPNPNSKTAQIVILPSNAEEDKLFREFKRVIAKDAMTMREFFLPHITAKAKQDNPQLHFINEARRGIILSKTVQANVVGRVTCSNCQGNGCTDCANKGWVINVP